MNSKDSIRGSLFGGAVGDALGYPVEFLSWKEIQRRYGADGIRDYDTDAKTGLALISDDTQMTLFAVCGLLSARALPELGLTDGLWRAWLDWLGTQTGEFPGDYSVSWILERKELHACRAPGSTCLGALMSGKKGSVAKPLNNSKGCGGVMRAAPLALTEPEAQGEALLALDLAGAEAAAVTHGHPAGFAAAAFVTHLIHQAAYRRDLSLRAAAREALKAAERLFGRTESFEGFRTLILRAVSLADGDGPDEKNIRALGGGWTGDEAAAIALTCALRYEHDFSAGVIAAVNHSGDSDSTGAITGSILGARLGYEAIDERWKSRLELGRLILELADDLSDGAARPDRYGNLGVFNGAAFASR